MKATTTTFKQRVAEVLHDLRSAERTVDSLIKNPDNVPFLRPNILLKLRTRAQIAELEKLK